MKRYTLILLSSLFTFLATISLFNLIIDPYAATDWVKLDGINAHKTRAQEDGRRVTVSHQILKRPETSLIIGSSRVVDGLEKLWITGLAVFIMQAFADPMHMNWRISWRWRNKKRT